MSSNPAIKDKVTKFLLKLIDYSIFPAVLVVSSKIIGILLFAEFFSVEYKMSGFKLIMNNAGDYALVNSYSSLLMLVSIFAGLLLVIIKAHIFHSTHITPALAVKVHDMNLEELINSTKTIYSQSFIWMAYIWLVTLAVGIQSVYGFSYLWIFYLALGLSSISTVFLYVDLKKEFIADKDLFNKLKKLGKGVFTDSIEEELI